jgi:hypothetical protein
MHACTLLIWTAFAAMACGSDGGSGQAPLPWRFGSSDAMSDSAQTPGSSSRTSVMTLSSLSQLAMTTMREDGTADIAELEAMLAAINRQVDASIAMPKHSQAMKVTGAPMEDAGWRLWAFWGVDVPEVDGLASALVQVRASALASVHPVHLAGMRHWEEWIFRMNDFREAVLAAAKTQDQQQVTAASSAWKAEVAPFDDMVRNFHGRGIAIMSDTRAAVALRVETVPCFRLISPANRIHAIDGFGERFDVVAWVERCQSWEVELDRAGGRR